MDTTGGFNGRRSGYRSVAFGTWKVGGARIITTRNDSDNKKSSFGQHLDASRKMGESSPNLNLNMCRLHPTDTQRSLGALPSRSIDTRLYQIKSLDYYSSSEYVTFTEKKDTKNGASESIQAVLLGDLTSQRRTRLENSLQRVHYRSASAGADTSYSIRANAIEMKNPLGINRENTRFLRATKKFFKKIYNSATLPNSKRNDLKPQVTEQKHLEHVEYGIPDALWYPSSSIRMVDDDIEDDYTSRIGSVCGSSPIGTDSGVDLDQTSTPEHSVESITIARKGDERDLSYSEIFQNLRREMILLRQRDHKILAELYHAEEQLRTARRTRDIQFDLHGFPI